jgi:plasmid maintenance system antidote protein VapI
VDEIKFDNRKLKGRIIEKFGTSKAFAKALGAQESNVSLKVNGKRELKRDDIFNFSRMLEIPDSEISEYFFTQEVAK